MRGRGLAFVPTDAGHRVTTLELPFDLVFVFAVTSVTSLMAHDVGMTTIAEGLVTLGLIWFGWSAYAWLGNQARADAGPLRVSMVFAMAAYFIVALTIGQAFVDRHGGLSGAGVFVTAYAVVRWSHLAVYALAAGDDRGLRRTVRRAFVATLPAMLLLVAGAFFEHHVRLVLWAIAVLIDYVGIFVTGASGWRVPAPGHFAERHQLVVIVAIGESIVSIGVGVGEARLTWALLAGALLGIAISVALWWTYFDVVALVAERVLARLEGDDRTRLARDTFTYLHLPVVSGIVYLALGIKLVLGQAVVRADGGEPAFSGVALLALYGGAALYLAAMAAVRWRDVGSPNVERLVAAAALVVGAVVAGAAHLTGLVNLLLVALVVIAVAAYEAVHFRATRARIRAEAE